MTRPGDDGRGALTGTGVAANSEDGALLTLTLAFRLDGGTGEVSVYAQNAGTDLAQIGLFGDGTVGVVGTGWHWLAQTSTPNAWNTLVVTHQNGTTAWSVSTNGSAFETVTASPTTSNWDNLHFQFDIGGAYAHLDAISLSAVPEPSTFVLAVAGLIGLLAYAWRKRR